MVSRGRGQPLSVHSCPLPGAVEAISRPGTQEDVASFLGEEKSYSRPVLRERSSLREGKGLEAGQALVYIQLSYKFTSLGGTS